MPPIGLYIHVPFCVRKCAYCDFYSITKLSLTEAYTEAAVRNLKAAGDAYDTVYFGGGTPSLLTPKQIDRILSAACVAADAEISMECNPNSVDTDYLREIKAAGINRLSLGIQSLDDGELAALGRLHTSSEAVNAILSAEKAGFRNVSADLMLAVPCQTSASLERTLKGIVKLPLEHISAYMLTIEKTTPLARSEALLKNIPNEDETADMYLTTVHRLADAGFEQYEISNFARSGYECRHNLKYWRCEEYLGIGPGAHSFLAGERFYCPKDVKGFISEPLQERISLGSGGESAEKAMLALRLTKEGLPLTDVGDSLTEKRAEPLIKSGLVKKEKGALKLTPEGCLVSNEIICRLVD